ncbi:MAG: hypothetical protein ACRDLY_17095, partial [Thermoleophilaceae bacterium]
MGQGRLSPGVLFRAGNDHDGRPHRAPVRPKITLLEEMADSIRRRAGIGQDLRDAQVHALGRRPEVRHRPPAGSRAQGLVEGAERL